MCTCIAGCQSGHIYLANNEDIPIDCGMLFSNQRDIRKRALMMPPDEPACWTSHYGSITFSQCGKEFPSGGMNECGLVIEQTTLRETVYPSADERPAIKELQMVQYLLDICRSVPEALEQMSALRIAQASARIQYMLLDRTGNCAIVAFIDGKILCYQGDDLPHAVLTNTHYPEALAFYHSEGAVVPTLHDEYAANSLKRFCSAIDEKQKYLHQTLTLDDIFLQLEIVERADTLWSIVYDATVLHISIQTRQSNTRKLVEFSSFDFANEATPMVFDLQNPSGGSVSSAVGPYSSALNGDLIRQFFSHPIVSEHLAPHIPEQLLEYLAVYPELMATGRLFDTV